MTPNVPLLRKMVEWVEEQEVLDQKHADREWTQQSFFINRVDREEMEVEIEGWCETTKCVAGKVVWEAGWQPLHQCDFLADDGSLLNVPVEKDGVVRECCIVADELLGIEDWAHGLYLASNSAEDIRRIAEELAGERL